MNDTINPSTTDRTFTYRPPKEPFLEVLFEDEHLLLVNKPSGLLSVRGRREEHQDSVQARAESLYPFVGIVHRLDMSTSGLMLLAKTSGALKQLHRQFSERKVSKIYLAKVFGIPENKKGVINLPLITDWPNRPKQKVCYEMGKPSETVFRVLEENNEFSLLELTPVTGRSHQLRVHLAELGHPILGDKFYAHDTAYKASPRLALHAFHLAFQHPDSNLPMAFSSEPDF